MGQVQFCTKFCSIRVVRYSFQQDYQDRGGADADRCPGHRPHTRHGFMGGSRLLHLACS